ncbi:MAG: TonB-dependent receptor domain-containing protein, partial [Candidatus Latescibacterota bacterium]
TQDVLWGGLANLAYQVWKGHEIGVNYFHSQNGEKTARHYSGTYAENISTERTFSPNVLSYNDRSLQSAQLRGTHRFGGDSTRVRVDWRSTFAHSKQVEPDLRYFSYTYNTDTSGKPNYSIFNNYFQHPTRTFRDLTENNTDNGIDITIPFESWGGHENSLKFGGAYSHRKRTFVQRQFEYQPADDDVAVTYTGNSSSYFSSERVGLVDSTGTGSSTRYLFGLTLMELKYPSSQYDGAQDVAAGYLMLDIALTERLRIVAGARYETTNLKVSNPEKTGKINAEDILPSANLIYRLLDSMNLRGAYSRTLARPTIREMAPYTTYDFGAGAYVVGNPNLKRTLISNYDLRWEWFPHPGDVYSVSAFYKDFKDPIERVIVSYDGQTTFDNVDEAMVMGLEFEARQSLGSLSRKLSGFQAGGNISLVRSRVDIPEEEMAFIRAYDPDAISTREFMGQSPYILNLDLSWDNEEKGLSSTLSYNVFGKRLSENSLGGTPDVYEKPASTLNLAFSKKVTANSSVKLSAKNILNSRESKVQEYRGREYIRSEFGKGRTLSLGLAYAL